MSHSIYRDVLDQAIGRLNWHKENEAGLLVGATVEPYPITTVSGPDDLPDVRIWSALPDEAFRSRSLAAVRLILNVSVATKRTDGVPSLMEWVGKVLDALETDTDGTVDPRLGGTLRVPFAVKTAEIAPTELSIAVQLQLTCIPRRTPLRGRRVVA